MKKGSIFLLSAALLVAGLLLAGCGGDEETSSLTRAEFVQQANAICKEAASERQKNFRAAIAAIDPAEAKSKSKEELLKDRDELVENVLILPYENATEQIELLEAPSGDEQKVQALIDAREAAMPKVEAKPQLALESTIQFAEPNKLAADYGLTSCVL